MNMDSFIRLNRHIFRPYCLLLVIWLTLGTGNVSILSSMIILFPIVLSLIYLYNDIEGFNIASVVSQLIIRIVVIWLVTMRVDNLISNIVTVIMVIYDSICLSLELITDNTRNKVGIVYPDETAADVEL